MERSTAHKPKHTNLTTMIAAGVGVVLTCALAIAAIANYRARVASEPSIQAPSMSVRGVNKASENSAEEVKRQELQRAALDQQAREQRAEQQRAVKEAMRLALEQRENEQRAEQRRASEAALGVLDEKTRKERAWAKFYKRSAYCDNDQTNEHTAQCANEFIRAQRQFREAYAAGKL
jgi:hypothetical protein